ncbi:MAG: Hint domain-containing protein [Pseudomonadota bacterium]
MRDCTAFTFDGTTHHLACLTGQVRIETVAGSRLMEELQLGELVRTKDNGPQPVRWIGYGTVPGRGQNAPIRIQAGALGNRRDLIVSPTHRMYLTGGVLETFFDVGSAFVAAQHLVNGSSVTIAPRDEVTYYHLMFDRHEVIYAEGALSESFHPGREYISAIREAGQTRMFELFPDLADGTPRPEAAPTLTPVQTQYLAQNLSLMG